jgi:hypothetical protein
MYFKGDQDKVFYENLPAEEAVNQGQCDEAEVLIVDPPRRGLDAGVLNLLVGKHETASAQSKIDSVIVCYSRFTASVVIDFTG